MVTRSRPGALLSAGDDLDETADLITSFLTDGLEAANREQAVIWLDRRIGSMVTAMLAVQAVGAEHVYGIAPVESGRTDRAVTGRTIASGLGIDYAEVALETVFDRFEDAIASRISPVDGSGAAVNAASRLSMTCAYYAANVRNGLVLGTLDRTRWLLGTAATYGGGVGDLLPLGHLYATEVRTLADHLGVPVGSLDADAGPVETLDGPSVDREHVDAILHELVDRDGSIDGVARDVGVPPDAVRACARQHATTVHKRTLPRIPGTDDGREPRFHELELRFE